MDKSEWDSLEVGDYVTTNRRIARKILRIQNGCIRLTALKKTLYDYVIYTKNDRYKFTKVNKREMYDEYHKHGRNAVFL